MQVHIGESCAELHLLCSAREDARLHVFLIQNTHDKFCDDSRGSEDRQKEA